MAAAQAQARVDWFSDHAPDWERVVLPALAERGPGRRRRALVVGAHEGRACLWLLQRRALRRGDALVVADPFEYPTCAHWGGVPTFVGDVRATFDALVAPAAAAAGVELQVLPGLRAAEAREEARRRDGGGGGGGFDLVAVDCTWGARGSLEALVRAFPMLAPGGVLVATNYTHSREHDASCPRRGIDAFLDCYVDQVRVVLTRWHVFARRRAAPLALQPCFSEYHEDHRPTACVPAAAPGAVGAAADNDKDNGKDGGPDGAKRRDGKKKGRPAARHADQ